MVIVRIRARFSRVSRIRTRFYGKGGELLR